MNKATLLMLLVLILGSALIGGLFAKLPQEQSSSGTCIIGEAPTEEKILTLPAILNPDKDFDGPKEAYGVDRSRTTQYKLIRLNVPMLNDRVRDEGVTIDPIFDRRDHTQRYDEANLPGFMVYYPGKFGEVTLDKKFMSKYEGLTTEFRFRQEGIIFLVHVDASGKPITVSAKDRKGVERQFWMVDLYQDIQKANDPTRGYTLRDLFSCSDTSVTAQKIIAPTPNVGDNRELQIGTFTITASSKGFDAHCKPAIYLYPTKPMNISVKVNTKGMLTYTDPEYPQSGWHVFAYPDGRINASGRMYDYLYYESRISDSLISQPKEGYVYSYADLNGNLRLLLTQLGLSTTQTNDFLTYWMKVLPRSPYYFVGIFSKKNLDTFEPLEITPKEDTMIRVRLYFKQLDSQVTVPAPHITTPQRHGFTVVEWGGMVKTKSGEAFTCLQ